MSKSREHHWWPVGLQKYWADKAGNINILGPDGSVVSKRYKNRKVGKKSHGHSMMRGSAWETNFEKDFENADQSVDEIINWSAVLKVLDQFGATFGNCSNCYLTVSESL